MVVGAIPAADVLITAVFKRRQKEALRVLIVLLCLASCRRGRRVVSFAFYKVRLFLVSTSLFTAQQLPFSAERSSRLPNTFATCNSSLFVLYFLGSTRRRRPVGL